MPGHLTLIDLWALLASVAACAFLALRSQMLRPSFKTLHDAPTLVWATLSGLAIVCAATAVSIWNGGHATAREAVLMTALALSSGALFWNLLIQARTGSELRHQP